MNEPVMKITDETGEVFWMDGHDQYEAINAFGRDATIELYVARPKEKPLTSDVTTKPKTETKLLDPKVCIANGGRKRCMDCRCGKDSPPYTVQETWKDYC